MADGCVQAGCALVGGETAEMPGFYPVDEYDLAGFSVGMVDRDRMIDGSLITEGDAIIGLQSSGVHSNGFSLVRKVFNISDKNINMYLEDLGHTIGEELLTPTKIYVKQVLALREKVEIKAISHITGGGFFENIPRMLKPNTTAQIELASLPKMPIFSLLQRQGNIPEREMYNTFNMGIGTSMIVSKEQANQAVSELNALGEHAFVIGSVVAGEEGVTLC